MMVIVTMHKGAGKMCVSGRREGAVILNSCNGAAQGSSVFWKQLVVESGGSRDKGPVDLHDFAFDA